DPEGDADVPLTLLIDGRRVARLRSSGGRAEHALDVATLGRPGDSLTVTAIFDGDQLRNPAQASRRVRLATPTTLALAASPTDLEWRGTLELSGQLNDLAGPIAGASISIAATGTGREREVASALTDGAGRFQVALAGGVLAPGGWFVEAR